ncbi:MAG: hypothetical protein HQL51_07910 [Magnetococcales bacterium]|nr:hypothetical protein [Magnetococcales bacterium]
MIMFLKIVAALGVVYVVGFFALIFFFVAGGINPEEERYRVTSPNGRMDAVIVTMNATMTVPEVNKIFIVSRGGAFDDGELIFKSHFWLEAVVGWYGDDTIILEYDAAKRPTNYVNVEMDGHRVRLVLNPRPTPCNLREESCPWHEKFYPLCDQIDQARDDVPCFDRKTMKVIRNQPE